MDASERRLTVRRPVSFHVHIRAISFAAPALSAQPGSRIPLEERPARLARNPRLLSSAQVCCLPGGHDQVDFRHDRAAHNVRPRPDSDVGGSFAGLARDSDAAYCGGSPHAAIYRLNLAPTACAQRKPKAAGTNAVLGPPMSVPGAHLSKKRSTASGSRRPPTHVFHEVDHLSLSGPVCSGRSCSASVTLNRNPSEVLYKTNLASPPNKTHARRFDGEQRAVSASDRTQRSRTDRTRRVPCLPQPG